MEVYSEKQAVAIELSAEEKAGVLKQYNEGIEVIKLDITALNNKL